MFTLSFVAYLEARYSIYAKYAERFARDREAWFIDKIETLCADFADSLNVGKS